MLYYYKVCLWCFSAWLTAPPPISMRDFGRDCIPPVRVCYLSVYLPRQTEVTAELISEWSVRESPPISHVTSVL